MDYEDLHWGDEANRQTAMKAATGRASKIEELKACSYVARKGGKAQIFRHEFRQVDGRGPYLLKVGTGSYEVEGPPVETISIGRAIDFETIDERVLLGAGCFFVTDADGEAVYLVSTESVSYAIEQRLDGPFVTERGIEA